MKREIAAKTFTPIYDELEDRLRLVINYQDIQNRVDFMITRSFIINLISTAQEFIEKHYGVSDFKTLPEQESKDKGTSKTDNVNLELLRTSEELLLEVNFSFNINSKHTILTLSSKNMTAKADLDGFMLTQVFQVMKSAIPYIRWGISYNF
ncbi:hypothetical protein [Sulfurimonas sp.]|jgi:hypothetical protein|uniref:hypothetical protein n=1 Tax=Sulfurimonas sp. TaxID=2022749 RepID=UPI002A36A459|nr:hypothetical protein [Sulfurimonas sp.]MDY0122989.1 hypothetical protein [Sulfurimonas sp.]